MKSGAFARADLVLLTLLASIFSPSLYSATNLVCTSDQNSCDIISSDFYNGDRVVIFNDSGEIVASGVIKSSEGKKRKINISKRFVKIQENDTVELNDSDSSSIAKLKNYKRLSQKIVGADLLLASYNFGSGITGFGFDGFGSYRNRQGFDYVARAFYQNLKGTVTSTYNNSQKESFSFSGNALGVTGGVGFNFLPRETFSVRGDLGFGFSYLSYSLGGELGSDTLPVSKGLGWSVSGFLGGAWNPGNGRHYHVGLAPGLLQNAFYAALSAGMSVDLK